MSEHNYPIRILFFARARDLMGQSELDWTCEPGTDVGQLKAALASRYPVLSPLLAYSSVAINCEYAVDSQVIPAHSQLAIIPPVSGG
jgi:molybdopterin converting factor small subunit